MEAAPLTVHEDEPEDQEGMSMPPNKRYKNRADRRRKKQELTSLLTGDDFELRG